MGEGPRSIQLVCEKSHVKRLEDFLAHSKHCTSVSGYRHHCHHLQLRGDGRKARRGRGRGREPAARATSQLHSALACHGALLIQEVEEKAPSSPSLPTPAAELPTAEVTWLSSTQDVRQPLPVAARGLPTLSVSLRPSRDDSQTFRAQSPGASWKQGHCFGEQGLKHGPRVAGHCLTSKEPPPGLTLLTQTMWLALQETLPCY